MRNLDHPHILRIFGWAQDCSSIFMIMESCDGGELLGAVKKARYKFNDMPEVWASTVMRQILEAMAYCHAKGVVHKDLKSGNILLLNRATPETLFVQPPHGVVADLGLCEICGSTDWCGLTKRGHQVAGTASTMAPEVWKGNCGPKCDIWSLGCVLFELFASRLPFKAPEGTGWQKNVWLQLHQKGPDWHAMCCAGKQARDLCGQMLTIKERNRPTALVCLQHPWFDACAEFAASFEDIRKVCEAARLWPERSHMQRALCLKLAAEQNATSRFAAIFSSFDADRSGTLSQAELIAALQKLGVDESTAKKTAVALDYDGDGTCEYLEFAAACLSSLGDPFDEMLWHEFKALDFRGQGQLTTKAMAPLFEKLTPLVLSRKLKIPNLDTDGDGLVNFEEFCTFFGRPGASHRRAAAAEAITQDSEVLDTFISETPHATLDLSSGSSDGDKKNSLDEGSGPMYTCWRQMNSEFVSPTLAGRTAAEAMLDPPPTAVQLLRDLQTNFSDGEHVRGQSQERSHSANSCGKSESCCLKIFTLK